MAYLKYMTPALFAHLDAWNIDAILYYCHLFISFLVRLVSRTLHLVLLKLVKGDQSVAHCQKGGPQAHTTVYLPSFGR